MRRRGTNFDAGASHPAVSAEPAPAPLSPEEQRAVSELEVQTKLTELMKPFEQYLIDHQTQPELLKSQGKELLQFLFAARGLTKSGTPEDIFAGRLALKTAEDLLTRYQATLVQAKETPLNPGKDYRHDVEKETQFTESIRKIVPATFNRLDWWKGTSYTKPVSPHVSPTPSKPKPVSMPPSPIRLTEAHRVKELPDAAIGHLEDGIPPVKLDLEAEGFDLEALKAHGSNLSDEELFDPSREGEEVIWRDAEEEGVAFAKDPEGYGTEHNRLVKEVLRRKEARERARRAIPPDYTPEQEAILNTARSADVSRYQDYLISMNERRTKDIHQRIVRLKQELSTIGFSWFSSKKRERKHQLTEALRLNQETLEILKRKESLINSSDPWESDFSKELSDSFRKSLEKNRALTDTLVDDEADSLAA